MRFSETIKKQKVFGDSLGRRWLYLFFILIHKKSISNNLTKWKFKSILCITEFFVEEEFIYD
ncbi:hypothetical protein BSAJGB5T_13140 [Bacillus safensis]|nr:hypothetical protein BSAJGB5T_13140 [Bacillus safensis]